MSKKANWKAGRVTRAPVAVSKLNSRSTEVPELTWIAPKLPPSLQPFRMLATDDVYVLAVRTTRSMLAASSVMQSSVTLGR